jgi:hypothetical protein
VCWLRAIDERALNVSFRAIAATPETKFVLVALVLRFASSTTADLSFGMLALLAMRGRSGAIHAIAMSWLFLMLSPAVAPQAAHGSIGRYLVLLAAAVMLVVQGSSRRASRRPRAVNTATLTLSVFIFYHSLFFSLIVDVSLLKGVSWLLAIVVLMRCWQDLSPVERARSENFLYVLLAAILVLSIPMLAIPQGRATNGTGFQGLLSHPQTFGVSIAMLGAWAALKVLAAPRATVAQITMVPVCCGIIVLSEARTALIAVLAGVVAAGFSSRFLSGRRLLEIMPGLRSPQFAIMMFFGLGAAPIILVALGPTIMAFISKRTDAGDLIEAYQASRGGLIEMMLRNIESNFFTGIGFGIGSVPEQMEIIRDPILGLPVSALVEKGALPFAVFEELGVFGFGLVTVWIGAVLVQCARNGIAPLGLTLVFLLVNMGEATLFSPGGFGLIGLVLITWGLTGGQVRTANARIPMSTRSSTK